MFSCRSQHSAHTLVRWRNPSSCVLTTKPLASHLRGADTPTLMPHKTAHFTGWERDSDTQLGIKTQGKVAEREKALQLNSLNFISVTNSQLASEQAQFWTMSNTTYLTPIVGNPKVSTGFLLLMLLERIIGSTITATPIVCPRCHVDQRQCAQ